MNCHYCTESSLLLLTCHYYIWIVITVLELSSLWLTCHYCNWHVITVTDLSLLQWNCHYCNWIVIIVTDFSLLLLTSHYCDWLVITVIELSLLLYRETTHMRECHVNVTWTSQFRAMLFGFAFRARYSPNSILITN